jgi:hypothetical protein
MVSTSVAEPHYFHEFPAPGKILHADPVTAPTTCQFEKEAFFFTP